MKTANDLVIYEVVIKQKHACIYGHKWQRSAYNSADLPEFRLTILRIPHSFN